MAACGIRAKGGQRIEFARLEPLGATRWLHCDGETKGRRVEPMNFERLLERIQAVDEFARREAARAVNVGLTLRNWSIGLYISEYMGDRG